MVRCTQYSCAPLLCNMHAACWQWGMCVPLLKGPQTVSQLAHGSDNCPSMLLCAGHTWRSHCKAVWLAYTMYHVATKYTWSAQNRLNLGHDPGTWHLTAGRTAD